MMWLTAVAVLTCATLVACLMPVELTDETFSSTINEGKPVFVKFYAPWYDLVMLNKTTIMRLIGVDIAND